MNQPELFSQPEPEPDPNIPKLWVAKLNGNEFKIIRLNDASTADTVLDNPDRIVRYLRPKLTHSLNYRPDVENMIIVHLSTRCRPIGFEIITQGTLDTLLVHPREVFKSAIVANSYAIVLVHNHPSGDPSPSEADQKVTRDLIRAGQLMKIEVKDHIVLGAGRHASLRELGYFHL
jgi:DNA repair protein RadC